MGDISEYFSVLEAARELGVSKSRVEQYIGDGRLKVEWLAGRRVVLKSEVAKLRDAPKRPAGRPRKRPAAKKPKRKKK